MRLSTRLLVLAFSLVCAGISHSETHQLPLFVQATAAGQTSVVRIHNNSSTAGEVSIHAVNDAGIASSAATLALAAGAALELSATQLTSGDASIGLSGGLGALQGDQRLAFDTDLSIQVFAYLRTGDGTYAALHDQVRAKAAANGNFSYDVPIFNPALDLANASELRLVNTGEAPASLRIEARDDSGMTATDGAVSLMLPAGHARTLTAGQLESGDADLTGQLGIGTGKWRLTVHSDQPVQVINLVRSSTSRLDNLSSGRTVSRAPADQAAFNARFLTQEIATRSGAASRKLTILAEQAFEEATDSADTNATTATQSGTYSYRSDSEHLGQLTLTYASDRTCELQLYFTSSDAGWYASECQTGDDQEGTWSGGSWTTDTSTLPPDPDPDGVRFSASATVGDQTYGLGVAITALTLPAATGGNGTLSYSLALAVPGLVFDPNSRELTGTPTQTGTHTVTYSVVDGNGTTDSVKFVITVREAQTGECTLGMILRPGDSCAYPGTSEMFSVQADGSARFLIISSETLLNIPRQTYKGTSYHIRAAHQGEGVWRIEQLDGERAPTGTVPAFPDAASPGDQTYSLDTAIDTLSLPEASGGEGALVYSLSPQVPGLSFNANTRRLSGTPTEAGSYAMTYRVRDADHDSDTIAFSITVRSNQGPDLIVESPAVGQSALAPSQEFTFSASVRNRGLAASGAASLAFYLSSDASISSGDLAIGTSSLDALVASATANVSTTLTAPADVGAHYVGACVSPVSGESNTANNCSTGVRITVNDPSGQPDLIVQSVTVSSTSVEASASITLNAEVRNQGGGQSASTTLRYYRSSNARITDSDTAIGSDSVATLAATGSSVESTRTSAPSSAGTYYYGACIDTVANESDAENNCSTGVRVTVRDRAPVNGPDLVVDSATVDDPSPEAGASIALSVRVRNRGNQNAAATTVNFYQSSDSSISAGDTFLSSTTQAALSAGGSNTLSATVTAPSSLGTYYYGACVVAVPGETSSTNNCSRGARIRVEVDGPDLRVGSASASPSNPGAGDDFRLNATVRNHGNMEAATTTLRYYQSTDDEISSSDTEVATDSIGVLSASRSSSESATLTAPDSPGTYYYGACVDSVAGETDATNNCGASVRVLVRGSDLVVVSARVDDAEVEAGDRFTFSASVRNSGIAEAPATTLRYYRSEDATISTGDTPLDDTDSVSSTSPNQSRAESVSLTAPSTPGTYYYGACVDTVTGEEDATNNCSSAVRLVVGAPDLVISSVSVDDSSPDASERFKLSVVVRNNGKGTAAATELRYLESADNEISADDREVTTESIGDTSPGESDTESEQITAPASPGAYYYYACVTAVAGESNTDNNCSSLVRVTVPAPDLVVQSPRVDDSTPDAGDTFRLSMRVRNNGRGTAAATTLSYYRSEDTTISAGDDTSLGTDGVASLSGSDSDDENILLTAPATPGTYYYGACVAAVAGESNTDNNCSSAVRVVVPAPDLIVTSPRVDDASIEVGDDFEFTAIVRNRGAGEAASTTLRYYESADSTISAADSEVGTDAVKSLSARENSNERVDITPPSAGTFYYGACVASVAGESNTDNNCSSGVRVVVSDP